MTVQESLKCFAHMLGSQKLDLVMDQSEYAMSGLVKYCYLYCHLVVTTEMPHKQHSRSHFVHSNRNIQGKMRLFAHCVLEVAHCVLEEEEVEEECLLLALKLMTILLYFR